jgi:hypothetical protein
MNEQFGVKELSAELSVELSAGEIAFRKCPYFPAKIDDLYSKAAQNSRFSRLLTTRRRGALHIGS